MKKNTKKLVYSALCLALCLVLPFLIGQIPQIGQMLSPMHIPVFLCGFLCGWPWGLAVGFIAPLLRSVLFHMPAMYPGAVSMAFELATYGAVSGLLYHLLPKKNAYIYVALIAAMLCGRVVWGIARYIMAGLSGSTFPWSAFLAGAFTNAIPGIILHIVLIPVLVMALKRARMVIND
ncbi:MAG: ECF transporter S component [Oscillospiraceae bacterium]|nr:ECF transporter S component [Oscillospiraceae bacterium]